MKLNTLIHSGSGRWVLAILVLLLLAAGILWMTGGKPKGDASAGLTYRVTYEPFTVSINESGTIESRNRVIIKSEVPGQQTIIYLIPEGTVVEKDQLLIELDASTLKDNLLEKEIELENAEAELISSQENLAVVKNQAEADIAQAKLDYRFAQQDLDKYREGEYAMSLKKANSKITLAKAELQQAEDRLNGSKQLFAKRYISETELESDELAKQRAQMDLELALQEKELLETYTYNRQMAQLESDVEQASLALEREERKALANTAQAEARFSARRAKMRREQVSTEELRERIEKCKITAPTGGMVVYAPQGNRWDDQILQEGLSVWERQELIYLPTADTMSAQIKVHETMFNKLKIGQPATITVDALPDKTFSGHVTDIAVMPEDGGWLNPELKQYKTGIAIRETSPLLRSGMSCKAEVLIAHFDQALTVPIQSVLRVQGQTTVFTPGPDGRPLAQPVTVGLDNNRKVQIIEGLSAGSEVLLNPPLTEAERGTSEDFPTPKKAKAPEADAGSATSDTIGLQTETVDKQNTIDS